MAHIDCPHCKTEIKVEVEMYIDEDVCYDLFIREEEAEELEVDVYSTIQNGYKCMQCKNNFELELDSDFWGDKDIPVLVKKI